MKTTRRSLFGIFAGLFAGVFIKAKAAPVPEVFWEKAGRGEFVRIAYDLSVPRDGPFVTYELLNEEMLASLKENPEAQAAMWPTPSIPTGGRALTAGPGRCWKTGFTLDDFAR